MSVTIYVFQMTILMAIVMTINKKQTMTIIRHNKELSIYEIHEAGESTPAAVTGSNLCWTTFLTQYS